MGSVFIQEVLLMHRFYADSPVQAGEKVSLSEEDTRHALRVLRLRPGSEIELFAGGRRYSALLGEASGTRVSVLLSRELPSTESALKITLYQGLPKADKMEWIIQKTVELGIERIVPVQMKRCVVRLDDRDAHRKTGRWQRIAREAGKQSGRCSVPEVTSPVLFSSLPELLSAHDACVVPWEEASGCGPRAFFSSHPVLSSLGIVIGPEGGIEPSEIEVLRSASCIPITLGPRILRTETAGLAASAAFLALYGEME